MLNIKKITIMKVILKNSTLEFKSQPRPEWTRVEQTNNVAIIDLGSNFTNGQTLVYKFIIDDFKTETFESQDFYIGVGPQSPKTNVASFIALPSKVGTVAGDTVSGSVVIEKLSEEHPCIRMGIVQPNRNVTCHVLYYIK